MSDDEPTTVSLFNEQSLRAAIVSVWGEHGAHAVVFDHLLALLAAHDQDHRVLWEGETRMVMHYDPRENGKDSFIPLPPEGFDVPPGTRVRVVVSRDNQNDAKEEK